MLVQVASLVLLSAIVGAEERPSITTILGDLQGAWETSANGTQYAAFTGVPYAEPPIGQLRFEPPAPLTPWHGTLDAGLPAPSCMSFHPLFGDDTIKIKGQEDCLYLNVYTHNLLKEKLLPVLVYIHGGAFMFGGSSFYGARYAMDRDIVFVTINYRLGPLGFLSLEDDVQPGNNGMRDQVAALKWIQDHISAFGGDPDQVTLIGTSAGGASVHYHYLSPLSRGLFKRGVSMSGTALCRWALADGAREKALRLAASVGCPTDAESQTVVECLKKRRAEDILIQVEQFQVWQYSPFSPFAPVVERASQKLAPFLPDAPLRMLSKGDILRAPWITGVTTHEGLYPAGQFIANKEELKRLDTDFELIVPHLLHFNFTVKPGTQGEVAALIRKEYFGDEDINCETVQQMVKMISDRLFVVDAQRAAEIQASHALVYFYEFGYRGNHSLTEILSGTQENFGTSHADDMAYFMNTSYITDENRTCMAKKVENLMLDLWSSFATNGTAQSNNSAQWEPVKQAKCKEPLKLLRISSVPPAMVRNINELGNNKFWESLPIYEEAQSAAPPAPKTEL